MSERRKNKAVFGILLMVFVFFIILMIFASYTMRMFQSGSDIDGIASFGNEKKSISVVEVNGVIMDAKATIELLHKVEKDKNAQALILRINSPGGAVGPTQEIYDEIIRIDSKYEKSKGKEGKPIYASFGSVAASGGYYIAAATRRIYSNPGTITGSIGVVMEFMDLSELFDWAKVKPQKVKAGRYKDMGNPGRAMTAEEKNMLEGMVEGVRQQFVRHIVARREKKIIGDIQEIAQGQIFSGEEALKVGLVDELASLWDAGRKIHKELKIEGEFALKFVKKKKRTNLLELVENLDESVSKISEMGTWKGLISGRTPIIMFK